MDSRFQAACIRLALPGNVQGRAMIDRGPYDWESEGDVDRFFKGESFNGDESLVVIHADVGIDIPASGFGESGVGWEGTGQLTTLCSHLFDGWQDDFFFLTVSEQPVFPRVWIETTDGDTRFFAK